MVRACNDAERMVHWVNSTFATVYKKLNEIPTMMYQDAIIEFHSARSDKIKDVDRRFVLLRYRNEPINWSEIREELKERKKLQKDPLSELRADVEALRETDGGFKAPEISDEKTEMEKELEELAKRQDKSKK